MPRDPRRVVAVIAAMSYVGDGDVRPGGRSLRGAMVPSSHQMPNPTHALRVGGVFFKQPEMGSGRCAWSRPVWLL